MPVPVKRGDEGGFTLAELLLAVTILGVIGFALTEAIIVGLKTTQGTADREGTAAVTQELSSYFTADAESAELVTDSAQDGDCASSPDPVVVHLQWDDLGVTTTAFYALSPAPGGGQDLVRYFCGGGPVNRRVLGHFTDDPPARPVTLTCGDPAAVPCPPQPASVTLRVHSGRADGLSCGSAPPPSGCLTVHRRTA